MARKKKADGPSYLGTVTGVTWHEGAYTIRVLVVPGEDAGEMAKEMDALAWTQVALQPQKGDE